MWLLTFKPNIQETVSENFRDFELRKPSNNQMCCSTRKGYTSKWSTHKTIQRSIKTIKRSIKTIKRSIKNNIEIYDF